jgi:hypothetical protein
MGLHLWRDILLWTIRPHEFYPKVAQPGKPL